MLFSFLGAAAATAAATARKGKEAEEFACMHEFMTPAAAAAAAAEASAAGWDLSGFSKTVRGGGEEATFLARESSLLKNIGNKYAFAERS